MLLIISSALWLSKRDEIMVSSSVLSPFIIFKGSISKGGKSLFISSVSTFAFAKCSIKLGSALSRAYIKSRQ